MLSKVQISTLLSILSLYGWLAELMMTSVSGNAISSVSTTTTFDAGAVPVFWKWMKYLMPVVDDEISPEGQDCLLLGSWAATITWFKVSKLSSILESLIFVTESY